MNCGVIFRSRQENGVGWRLVFSALSPSFFIGSSLSFSNFQDVAVSSDSTRAFPSSLRSGVGREQMMQSQLSFTSGNVAVLVPALARGSDWKYILSTNLFKKYEYGIAKNVQ